MVANFNTDRTAELLKALATLPQEWALTPCVDKENLWTGWKTSKLDRTELSEAIRTQKNGKGKHTAWTGFSIVTGELSNGVMAIDFDGPLAYKKYLQLSGGASYPTTKRWTSGKPGHFQILLQVPKEKWAGLKATKFFILNPAYRLELGLSAEAIAQTVGTTVENIEQWEAGTTSPIPRAIAKKLAEIYGCTNSALCQKLELRWNECSTLPPSIHPGTGKPYFWENEAPITECPDFLLGLMREAPAIELPQKPKPENPTYIDAGEKSLVEILENEILPRLDAEEFYGNWVALKKSGDNLKGLCPFHEEKTGSFTVSPAEKLFNCFGCGVGGGPVQFLHQIKGGTGSPTGKEFYEVVIELADRTGVQMPDRKFQKNSDIKVAIGEKKVFSAPTSQATSKVVRLPQFQVPPLSELGEEVDELLDSDLKKSQIQLKISELAQKYRVNSADVWKIYRDREQEFEQESDRPDVATEIENLLSAHKSSIALTEVLPVGLAQPIEKLAAMLNLRSECYLAALLTQVSSLFKVGTETVLRRDTDWRCVPNYNAGIVAEVSQLKTPIPKAIIDRPMRVLRERAQKEFQKAQIDYETELNNWNKAKKDDDRGPAPKPPRPRLYMFDKTTGEGIIYQQAEFPEQAMMYFCDELAGMLKSGNQYRGGKGSDEEDMLSFWNGTGTTVLRASGVRASVEAVGLSIFGTIQPDVLAGLLKDCSDSNGKFARFDFVIQPLAVPNLPEDDSGRFDLTPLLSDLYQKIDALPAIFFEFDREAKKYHRTFTLACHKRRVFDEPKQGLRGALGKMPEKVGKLATTIHALTCVFNGQQVTNQIPRSAVEAAAKFVKFAADQVASLYTEFSDRSALAPNLTKIILLAERKGGTLTVRDCQKSFDSKNRPNAQQVKSWFRDLALMNYGAVVDSNKTSSFVISAPSVTNAKADLPHLESLHSKGSKDDWGNTGGTNLPHLESLHSNGSELNVTNCHYILQPSEIQGLKQPEFLKDEKTLFPHSPTVTDASSTHTAMLQDLPQSEKIAPPVVTDAGELIAPPEPETAPTAQPTPPESIDSATGLNESGLKIGDWFEGVGVRTGIKGEIINILPNGEFAVEFYSPAENDKLRRVFAANELRKSTPEAIALPASEPVEPAPASVLPEVEEADAMKMWDIALVWWPEMYPEGLQSLVAQMWGWGAPARKYSAAQIARWLEDENEVVKYRIGELMAMGLADNYKEDEENE